MKRCSKCRSEPPIAEFYARSSWYCKACARAYWRAYYLANKRWISQYKRLWYQKKKASAERAAVNTVGAVCAWKGAEQP